MLSKYKVYIIFLLVQMCSYSYSQDSTNILQSNIRSIIDKYPLGDCSFHVTSSSAVYEGNKIVSYKIFVILDDDDLMNICNKHSIELLNKSIYPLLYENKYSWTANLMLFYINGINGESLYKFKPREVNAWTIESKRKHILFWGKYLNL